MARKLAKAAVFFTIILQTSFSCSRTSLEKRAEEYLLPNGMKWFLVRRGYAPVFAGIVQAKVGGVDEEKGKAGLAHILEHMAFKGTSEIGADELWDIFTRNGAVNLNAYTSKDVTAYYAEMPASKLELWIYLVSQMISDPAFREFDTEKDVVMEEYRSSIENSPTGMLFKKLLETSYSDGPYSWMTLGNKAELEKLTREDLKKFYERNYTAECLVGAIVGDINVSHAKAFIKRYFSRLKGSGGECKRDIPAHPKQNEMRTAVVEYNAEPLLVIGFHKPTAPKFDDYVFDVFQTILCEGESSRLVKKIVKEKKIARSVTCSNSYPGTREDNLFIIYAEPFSTDDIGELISEIEGELKRLGEEQISLDEFNKAKNRMKTDFLTSLDSNFELAHMLVYFENVTGDWRYILTHAKNIDRISLGDIMSAAKKYFVPENTTIIELRRKGD